MADNYFGAIVELADKFIRLDQRVLVNTILRRPEIQRFIIQLNTKGKPTSQLFNLNVDSEGVRLVDIGGEYSPFTIQKAIDDGRPKKSDEDINLHDEGDYYASFRVSFPSLAADFFEILHNPIKPTGNLEDDWGENLAGLTIENAELVAEMILPHLIDHLLNLAA